MSEQQESSVTVTPQQPEAQTSSAPTAPTRRQRSALGRQDAQPSPFDGDYNPYDGGSFFDDPC